MARNVLSDSLLGRLNDLLDWIKANKQRALSNPHLHARRVYSLDVGCSAPIAVELEFESYAERDNFWAAWFADPEPVAGAGDFWELIDRYWTSETWKLEE